MKKLTRRERIVVNLFNQFFWLGISEISEKLGYEREFVASAIEKEHQIFMQSITNQ